MQPAPMGLTAVYEQESAALLRFLRARCGDAAEAEDLLQDLWLKLNALSTGPIANSKAYLFRMANNLVLDRRRARMRLMQRDRAWIVEEGGSLAAVEPELRPDTAMPADEVLAKAQEASILHQAIAQLPPGARQALFLFRFEGHNQTEIAQILGISRSGVEKHLAVAMKHLRQAMEDCGAFDPATSQEHKLAQETEAPKEQGQ